MDILSWKSSLSNAAAVQGFGAGAGGGGGGGDDGDATLTQHLMSESPGQNPAWNLPPEQPLFLTLRQ